VTLLSISTASWADDERSDLFTTQGDFVRSDRNRLPPGQVMRELQETALSSSGLGSGLSYTALNSTSVPTQAYQKIVDLVRPQPPNTSRRHNKFTVLQEWEGVVADLTEGGFTATLIDQTVNRSQDEVAEFPLSEVSDDDSDLVVVGALFRWTIGFVHDGGSKQRVSQLVFRRLPQWTKRDMERADARAAELLAAFPKPGGPSHKVDEAS